MDLSAPIVILGIVAFAVAVMLIQRARGGENKTGGLQTDSATFRPSQKRQPEVDPASVPPFRSVSPPKPRVAKVSGDGVFRANGSTKKDFVRCFITGMPSQGCTCESCQVKRR